MSGNAELTYRRRAMVFFAVLATFAVFHAEGGESSLEELEMEYLLDQASRAFEKQDLSIEQMSADFKFRCLRAIGDAAFCECLVKERPYSLRFEQYVSIVSRTKAELGYDTLGSISQEIVDKVYLVRNECVTTR